MTVLPLHPLLVQARAAARVYRAADEEVATTLARVRLSTTRCLVLEALDRAPAGGLSLGQIAQFLGVHRSSAAESVDGLLAAGLVRRGPDPHDGRRVLVELETVGAETLRTARGLLSERRLAETS